jgi:macrolide-specific efflux system membrane fusion protein
MKTTYKWLIAAGVAVLCVAGFTLQRETKKPIVWNEVRVKSGEFKKKISATGSVTPLNLIVVTAPINGRIDKIMVEDGTVVRKKQVLAWMSSQDRAALLDALETSGDKENQELSRMYKATPIVAPEGGQVISKTVVKGQNVGVETTLFQISDRLVFVAKVDETDIGKVAVDQPVQVRVDAFPDQVIEGRTHHIVHQSSLNNNITTYDVYIETVAKAMPINFRSGMSMTADFILTKKDDATIIPSFLADGVQNGKLTLQVKNSAGDPAPREVQVGLSNGENVEVVAGLKPDDVVMYHDFDAGAGPAGGPLSLFGKKKK